MNALYEIRENGIETSFVVCELVMDRGYIENILIAMRGVCEEEKLSTEQREDYGSNEKIENKWWRFGLRRQT